MPDGPWINAVRHIQDGEPVDAGVAGRPDRALEIRDNYLKGRLDAAETGEGVVAPGVALDPALRVAEAVYWAAADGRFAQAIARVATDPATGILSLDPAADCLGLVVSKTSAAVGDVLMYGRHLMDPAAAAAAGMTAPGRYYLSASRAGGLSAERPPLSLPVLYWDGQYAYTAPCFKDFLGSHVHHAASLVCRPASSSIPVTQDAHRAIGTPLASAKGWLPAGHPSFGGAAPTGAAFGYNLAADAALSRIWPPVPLASAVLVWDRGGDGGDVSVGGQVVPLGPSGLCVIDRRGLWWMSDCTNDVPWPAGSTALLPPPIPPNGPTPECPRLREMAMTVWFTEMLSETSRTAVTSLRPAAGSPITVVDCNGVAATGDAGATGDLQLDLNLAFLQDDERVAGDVAFKSLAGVTFKRGYVVESLVQGANVRLTPTRGVAGHAQGTVTIDVENDLSERVLSTQIVRLDNAKEQFYGDIPSINFPADRRSHVRLQYRVPVAGLPADPHIALRLWVYGQSSGTLPPTTTSYRRLARPATAGSSVSPPSSDTAMTCNTNVSVAANSYVEVTATPVAVAPGDTLLVQFTRTGPDGYAADLALLIYDAVIVAGAGP